MLKKILNACRTIHGRFYEKRIEIKKYRIQRKELIKSSTNSVFLVGTPTHPNVGDSAIAYSEGVFLKKILPKGIPIVEITEDLLRKNATLVIRKLSKSPKSLLMLHGGGNMGDLWIDQEMLRRKLLARFSDRRIIMFPQSIFYSKTEAGMAQKIASVPIYNDKEKLTLIAREKMSYDIMRSLYPQTQALMIPDIVLSTSPGDFGVKPQSRDGVLMCLRNDGEKCVKDFVWNQLKQSILQLGYEVRFTDMSADRMINKEIREEIIKKKMQEFCCAELAITDRLHGMVFAVLTGTPCLVFGNYNHKVKGTYDWIHYLPFVRFVKTKEEADSAIPELLAMNDCNPDLSPLNSHYDILKEIILEAYHNSNA